VLLYTVAGFKGPLRGWKKTEDKGGKGGKRKGRKGTVEKHPRNKFLVI